MCSPGAILLVSCFGAQLTRSLIEDMAKGLAHLHNHDTWHGDLKSLNILLTADHRASVRGVDFWRYILVAFVVLILGGR